MPHRAVEAIRGKADRWNLLLKHMKSFRRAFSGSNRSPDAFGKGYFSWRVGKQSECKPCDVAGAYTVRRTIHIAPVKQTIRQRQESWPCVLEQPNSAALCRKTNVAVSQGVLHRALPPLFIRNDDLRCPSSWIEAQNALAIQALLLRFGKKVPRGALREGDAAGNEDRSRRGQLSVPEAVVYLISPGMIMPSARAYCSIPASLRAYSRSLFSDSTRSLSACFCARSSASCAFS